ISVRPREGATCTSAANAASYKHRRMPRPRSTHTARYAGSLRTCESANSPADTNTVPRVITARAVAIDSASDRTGDEAHGQQGDGKTKEHEATGPAGVLADRPSQHAEA